MTSDTQQFQIMVTCPKGLEELLKGELEALGCQNCRLTITAVIAEASYEQYYRACLYLRTANKVILLLAAKRAESREELYALAESVQWTEALASGAEFLVDFSGRSKEIRHTQFGAQVVKDAIVDQFVGAGKERPSVNIENPDVKIFVRLTSKCCYIGLDLLDESLHKRRYREAKGAAPLKENLAAALLMRSRWQEIAESGGACVDPMCGAATILIEAALMAANVPPGLVSRDWKFKYWNAHQVKIWNEIYESALAEKTKGLESLEPRYFGVETDSDVYEKALLNVEAAGLSDVISIENSDFEQLERNDFSGFSSGLVITNPPYGERLGNKQDLVAEYRRLADSCKRAFSGWGLSVLSSEVELLQNMRLRFDKQYKLYNGPIECELRVYTLQSKEEQAKAQRKSADKTLSRDRNAKASDSEIKPLSDGAQMVFNRLKKNQKKLKSWLKRESVQCYRLYDADLPEYSAAIDVYKDLLHVQEYQAPRSIDPQKAQIRFDELIDAVARFMDVSESKIFKKQRRQNKGKRQYEKLEENKEQYDFVVQEFRAKLLVNLKSYLDTGLFLDHRPLRKRIAEEAAGKKFLNLFCYTATATVHAAMGGASSSVSVDMSNTYLDWAKRNFELNNIHLTKHKLVRANVNDWLSKCREGFDLIMLDPPSFSNSKKMDESFDVQRDHVSLIKRCSELLTAKGVLYFSNNLRTFKLDKQALSGLTIEDMSRASLDLDYEKNPKIHQCWKITLS